MARALEYTDAVILLGGDTAAVAALDKALGGALMVAAVGGAAIAGALFDSRDVIVGAGHTLVAQTRDRLRGYSWYDRTQRLLAAHSVLVVTAFFEALARLDLPYELSLTTEDQLRLAGASEQTDLVDTLLNLRAALPGPDLSPDRRTADLERHYRQMAQRWATFVRGLSIWDSLDETRRRLSDDAVLRLLPALAVERYESAYRRLAVEIPEFGWWSGDQDHRATHR